MIEQEDGQKQDILNKLIGLGISQEQIDGMEKLGLRVVQEGGGVKEQKSEFDITLDGLDAKFQRLRDQHLGLSSNLDSFAVQQSRLAGIQLKRIGVQLEQMKKMQESTPPYLVVDTSETLEKIETTLRAIH